MKKNHLLLATLLAGIAITGATLRETGSPGGYTGSPMDGQNCTMCHTSFVAQMVTNLITTNIPQEGYEPGRQYQITVAGSHTGAATMGFELTAESGNSKVGSFSASSTAMQLVNNNSAVTHVGNAINTTNGSRSWTVNWTAPENGVGDVTFYAAVNAGDGNDMPTGDQTYLSSLTVSESSVTAVRMQVFDNASQFFYPNPAVDFLYMTEAGQGSVTITDLSGNLLISQDDADRIDLNGLASGVYFVKKTWEGQTQSAVLIKK